MREKNENKTDMKNKKENGKLQYTFGMLQKAAA